MTAYYALKINDEEVHRGGTNMNKWWEEVKLELTKDVESMIPMIAASTEEESTADMEESSGGGAKSSWMLVMMVMGAGAAALGWN